MPRNSLLKTSRLIHLYFGVFITPALIFFAFTGALQTFGLHETNREHPNYKPARWMVVLGQLHKKQTTIVPVRRQPPPQAASLPAEASRRDHGPAAPTTLAPDRTPSAAATPAQSARPAEATPQPNRHPLPLRIFFLIVSVGLFTSTITGLYMTYKYVRNKILVTFTLVAGVVLPLILVFL